MFELDVCLCVFGTLLALLGRVNHNVGATCFESVWGPCFCFLATTNMSRNMQLGSIAHYFGDVFMIVLSLL